MATDGKIIIGTELDQKGFESGLRSMESSADRGMGIIKSAAAGVGLAIAAVGTAVGVAGFKFNSQMEQYKAGFTSLLGSADKANQMVSNLQSMASKTPFELTDLAKASQTLLAFGTDAESIMPTLKNIGDVSLGNKERFQALSLAFGQVQASGRLMGNDLLQMVNAGFNPLQEISIRTGKSMEDLRVEMSNGEITTEMVAKAFQSATSEGGRFAGAMETQSKTLAGQWSTIKDNFGQLSGKILEPLYNFIATTLLPKINELMTWLNTKIETGEIQKFLDILILIGQFIVPVIAGLIAFKAVLMIKDVIVGVTQGIQLFNAALAANPILAVVSLILMLVTYLIYLWNTNEGFRNAVTAIWNAIVQMFKDSAKWITDAWNSVVTFFSNMWTSIVKFFKDAADFIMSLWKGVLDWFVALPGMILSALAQLPYLIGYTIGLCIGYIVKFAVALWDFVTVTIPQWIAGVVKWFSELPGKIWTWLVEVVNKMRAWFSDMWNKASVEIPKLINSIGDWFAQLPSKIWTWLVETVNKMRAWFSDMWNKASVEIPKLINGIVKWFQELPGKMVEVGKNVVKGIWNGISGAAGWIIGKVQEFAKGILDGMKAAMGIKSPSKITAGFGKYLAQGLGIGFEDEISNVYKKMSNVIDLQNARLNWSVQAGSSYNNIMTTQPITIDGTYTSYLTLDGETITKSINKINDRRSLQYGY